MSPDTIAKIVEMLDSFQSSVDPNSRFEDHQAEELEKGLEAMAEPAPTEVPQTRVQFEKSVYTLVESAPQQAQADKAAIRELFAKIENDTLSEALIEPLDD